MHVVVTGGTGFIGKRLVARLVGRGDSVTVLGRGARGTGPEKFVTWDPRPGRDTAWMSSIDRADAVVHLAGAGVLDERWSEERLRVIRSSRTESTALVAEAIAKASARPKVWLSCSAVGIYGMRSDDRSFDEEATDFGTDVLADVCKAWEAAADSARSLTRVVHPRIGVVLAKDDGALAQMLPAFRLFAGGPLGRGTQWMSWIHWKDAVEALVRAIDDASLAGPVNVVGPNPCTMQAFAETLGRVMRRPSFFRVPSFAAKLMIGEGAEVVLSGQRVLPKKLRDVGFAFEHATLESALRAELG